MNEHAGDSPLHVANALCLEYQRAWEAGEQPRIEAYVARVEREDARLVLQHLIAQEIELRRERGEEARREDYLSRFSSESEIVDAAFDEVAMIGDGGGPEGARHDSTQSINSPYVDSEDHAAVEPDPVPDREKQRETIGRFELIRELGRGAFGIVHQAFDPNLDRDVALKLPRTDRSGAEEKLAEYIREAKNAASLNHPGIVQVYDLHEGDPLYIVQEFIDGCNLADYLKSEPLSSKRVVELLIGICEALQHAHQERLFHRDLKPANILIDKNGHPHIVDFGLALRESLQHLEQGGFAGTPAYSSPEQVRGESHNLDGRSDTWSVGVIFYEMLTGRLPFRSLTMDGLFDQIKHRDPPGPREIEPGVPEELQRICLKCLEKLKRDRYLSVASLLDDLRRWESAPTNTQTLGEQGDSALAGPVPVHHRGLRSFKARDSRFFLQLLPGQSNREGLPESVSFWKTRIDETDSEKTFPVGVLWGPSGCGKSSLLQAGLLPRLGQHVTPIYVEATRGHTELRLLKEIRRCFPGLSEDEDLDLPQMFVRLREGDLLPSGCKLLVVLDQFEQWLLQNSDGPGTQLLAALRHCDGARVQCLVTIRDDFSLRLERFMRQLEVPWHPDVNVAVVDLFSTQHARKVLSLFGQSVGQLGDTISPEQQQFVEQAVDELADEDRRVVSLHLALFAQIMRNRDWTPAGLKEIGGLEGVGVTFLNETFAGRTALPNHRLHEPAARRVLRSLLPPAGIDIKSPMVSAGDLQGAAEYGKDEFEDLLRILDQEVRLITPTEPYRGSREVEPGEASSNYQLTHDYLVPSLRKWLTEKQSETARGRTELLLAERSGLWNAKPEDGRLPSRWEHLNIRLLTRSKRWTADERKMMLRAARVHGRWIATWTALLLVAVVLGLAGFCHLRANQLVDQIVTADIRQVDRPISQTRRFRMLTNPRLENKLREFALDQPERVKVSLALLETDPDQATFLVSRLPFLKPNEVEVVRAALAKQSNAAEIAIDLWESLDRMTSGNEGTLPVASTLALLIPGDSAWEAAGDKVAEALVQTNAEFLGGWLNLLEGAHGSLLPRLTEIYADRSTEKIAWRKQATDVLKRYTQDRPNQLAELLLIGDPTQVKLLYPEAMRTGNAPTVIKLFNEELDKRVSPSWEDPPGPGWQTPDVGAVTSIELAGGHIAPDRRLAFCQAMPRKKFEQVAEQLRSAGFRPTRVRPYLGEQELLVAAVWRRDGRAWKLVWDQDKAAFSRPESPAANEGFIPTDVAGYIDPSHGHSAERYVVLWSELDSHLAKQTKHFVLVGLAEQQVVPAIRGYPTLETLHVFRGLDDRRKYSGIWSSSGEAATLVTAYAGWERADQPQWDVSLAEVATIPEMASRFAGQLAAADKVLQTQPNDPQQLFARAKAHLRLGNDEQALTDLDRLQRLGNGSAAVHQYRAWVLARQGKAAAAREALARFQQAGPSDSQRMYAEVPVAAWLGRHKEALQRLDETVTKNAANGKVLYDAACAASLASWPGKASHETAVKLFGERALELLTSAVAAGYDDGSATQSDPDFAPLQANPRFRELVAPLRYYTGLWRADTRFESRLLSGLSPKEHVQQSRELIAQGYRPVSIAVMQPSGASSVAASVWHRPVVPDSGLEELAMRQASAAAGLLGLNRVERIWPLLEDQADPRLRSYLLDRLAPCRVDPQTLLEQLKTEQEQEQDLSKRRAILLALGELAASNSVGDADRQALTSQLLELYRRSPDTGIHSAAEWALKQLKQEDALDKINQALATGEAVADRRWYVTKQGAHTLAILDPDTIFQMGSPVTEAGRFGGPTGRNEIRHRRSIPRRFAIGVKEVTVGKFNEFVAQLAPSRQRLTQFSQHANDEDAPAQAITWYAAAEFCNWLSEQEEIPRDQWCYDPDQPFANGMTLYPSYLERIGYRLPTEAEWEYACRAGATTARFFGETATLLDRYAWYTENSDDKSTRAVGSMRPNAFGLFDTLGNVSEWCQDVTMIYPTNRSVVLDQEQLRVLGSSRRTLRGGSFVSSAEHVRSAYRLNVRPGDRIDYNGFRIARTYD